MQLSCALVLLSGDGPAQPSTNGGVFAVSLEPTQLVSELKEAIKRKKPHDLRHVDADALTLFLALDGAQWLSDEHDAALTLETRGTPVHDVVTQMLGRSDAMLRATRPLRRYFLEGPRPPPEHEQIHVLAVVPATAMGKRRMQEQESVPTRSAKAKTADYIDIVHILDSDDEGASDYHDPPRPLRDQAELYQRMGKVCPTSPVQLDPVGALLQSPFAYPTSSVQRAPVEALNQSAFAAVKEELGAVGTSASITQSQSEAPATDTTTTAATALAAAAPQIVFSEEQNAFIKLAVEKRNNLLLVAPAGYGKSAVIKTVIELFGSTLPSVNNQLVCGLCAPTGKAASLIGGRTIHSYLGIGLGRGPVTEWVKRVRSASFLKPTLKALRAVQVIVIDEVSMVSAQFLDRISEYLQQIRSDMRPFGGVQMILVGDLCQLPPVEGAFMFRSVEYTRAKCQPFQFTKCFRQNDTEFVTLLNEVRFARCSEQTMATLRKCMSIAPEYANGLTPMRIVSTNKEVDTVNDRELHALVYDSKAELLTYNVRVSPFANPKKAEAYRKADGIPEYVKIAVGCQVVVTQNLGQGIVNGTQGCVTAADAKKIELKLHDGNTATIEYFAYKDPEEPDVFEANTLFSYMPLRLGYASTVHKAQGMTLKLLEVDLKRVFAHGQLYTALSRVTDLRGLMVKNLTQRAFICHEAVFDFYKALGDNCAATQ